jgi:hypothetical protein
VVRRDRAGKNKVRRFDDIGEVNDEPINQNSTTPTETQVRERRLTRSELGKKYTWLGVNGRVRTRPASWSELGTPRFEEAACRKKRARRDELDRDLGETTALEVERNPSWASCTKEQQPAMGGGGQASWGWPTALGLDALDTEREQEEAEAELGTGARHGREQSELRPGNWRAGRWSLEGCAAARRAGRTMADRNNEAARRAQLPWEIRPAARQEISQTEEINEERDTTEEEDKEENCARR